MPERAAYDEAIQLSQARLKVQDPELKQGTVETVTIQTVAGAMKRPWGVQGGFAVVYKFRTKSGKMRALSCFLVQMTPDIQFRYERIGTYFAAHAPENTVGFKYYNSGIVVTDRVHEQLQNKTYPVIEKDWVEGITLVEHLNELCRRPDRARLEDVVNQWLTTLRTLRSSHISHGDLAGVNVMVRTNGHLVLVDFDGVYIPDFASLPQIMLGKVDYQHPEMRLRPFNERTDDFSALVIYTTLLALQAQPELWDKYTFRNAQGALLDTNFLFKQQDFIDTDHSIVFADLEKISDTRFKGAVQTLKVVCQQSIAQVTPFDSNMFDLYFDKKRALFQLEQALQHDSDEKIVKAWDSAMLNSYGPAQQYAARVGRANQTIQALKRFQDAFQTRSLQQISIAFDPILIQSNLLTQEQIEVLGLAHEFAQAYETNSDQAIVSAWEAIEDSRYKGNLTLTAQQQQRIALAKQRKEALMMFRQAWMNKNINRIVDGYDAALLDTSTDVTPRERELLRLAQDFVQAYLSDDDLGIAVASDEIENFSYRTNFLFTAQEKLRSALAQQRKVALIKFHLGLMSKNAQQMIANYDWILDGCKNVTAEERDILRIAKDFVRAYHENDDEAIANTWEAIQKASYQKFFIFSALEQQRINEAVNRVKLKRTLQNQAYDTLGWLSSPVREVSFDG